MCPTSFLALLFLFVPLQPLLSEISFGKFISGVITHLLWISVASSYGRFINLSCNYLNDSVSFYHNKCFVGPICNDENYDICLLNNHMKPAILTLYSLINIWKMTSTNTNCAKKIIFVLFTPVWWRTLLRTPWTWRQ